MKSAIGQVILGPTCLVGIQTGEVQFVSFRLFRKDCGDHRWVEPSLGVQLFFNDINIDVASFFFLVHRARYQFPVDRESTAFLSILWR